MSISPLFFYWSLLRLPDVLAANGQGRATFYAQLSDGLWPQSVSIGPRAVGWPAGEIATVIASRVAGQADDEIRALIKQLEGARKTAPRLVAEMCTLVAETNAASESHDRAGTEVHTLISGPKKARNTNPNP